MTASVRTTCPYCGVGCGLVATPVRASDDSGDGLGDTPPPANFDIRGDAAHPANFGRVCSKGAALGETLGVEDRLLHPEIRGRRASWDDALDVVARGFAGVVARHGPDAVAFYVSGQLLTEDYYVANKLMKGFIGSGNIDTNSRLCMASAVAGYKRAFGADVVPNDYTDLEQADLLVLVGSNTAWCHPVLYQRIVKAKDENPRMRVFVVDPRRTATCDIADVFLPIKPGTDVMLFNGLLNYLRREDALDLEFLDAHTEGFGAAMRVARETAPSIPAVAAVCGVPETDVAELYRAFARTPRAVTVFSQGVNQSSSGTDKVNAIVNVHLATGRIGKPGAGPFSLTGQPNAMGGREVGGLANQLAAHMDFTAESCERVQRFWASPRIATGPGLKAVDLFEAVAQGRVKALWIMSTNPAVSMPDAERVRAALAGCELVVVSDCVRRTDTSVHAHVLLPAATWGEKSGTVTNSERRISRQRAFMPSPGESRPDWWIVTAVARRMGYADAFPYEQPAEVFREHARLSAFENDGTRAFDIGALAAISDVEFDALTPVQWPKPAAAGGVADGSAGGADGAGEADGVGNRTASTRPFTDGRFFTPTGKARFVATELKPPRDAPSGPNTLILNTGRIRDQWHTMTRTGRTARLTGRSPEPFVQVHPADAAAYGVSHGDLAELRNERGRVVVRTEVTADVQPGQLFAPMHWSDQFASAARVGSLFAPHTDPVSGQPELKHAAVRLARFSPRWHGFAMSRSPLELDGCSYLVRARGDGFWRYEMAGYEVPSSWAEWASTVLGAREERVEYMDTVGGRYRGARIVGNRLQACVFISATKALPSRTWLGGLFGADAIDDDARRGILAGRPGVGALESGPIVCSCFSVGRSTLLRAIRTQALVTIDDVGKALRAGTNCGSCLPEVKVLLAEVAEASAVSG